MMAMQLTLKRKTFLGDNAWAFAFEPERSLEWKAGQFLKIRLPHSSPDQAGDTRRFTIAAAPFEKCPVVATRITKSSFKQALHALKLGESLQLVDTPAGDFLWQPAPKPHIMVAQGIGITPFYAIFKDQRHTGTAIKSNLHYYVKPHQTAFFEQELAMWAEQDKTFKLTYEESPLTPQALADKYISLSEHQIYVSGPRSFLKLCLPPYDLPTKQLKQDNFPGYQFENY